MHRVHYKSFNLYLHIYVELLINQIIILRILITDWYDKKIQIREKSKSKPKTRRKAASEAAGR